MNNTNEFEGVYSLGKNGIAYIKNRDTGEFIEIPSHLHKSALHKDLVRVAITDAKQSQGEILEVIKRSQAGFVGIISHTPKGILVRPDNFKIPDIHIGEGKDGGAKEGSSVFVVIDEYEPRLSGHIEKLLGDPASNDAHMHGIALEQGFDYSFPKAVEAEAAMLESRGIQDKERAGRRDMKGVVTFTIDPADAKDFDDALSFQTLENGNYEIGVHIADVSYYLPFGGALDGEAQKRTTSVYLVDRTIPMLPEVLSNRLCSLRQGEEKLAFSAVFEIVPSTGEVVSEWFGRSIIESNKRFTYEEAQSIIDKGEGLYVRELLEMNRLSKIYQKNRYEKGALNFDTNEVKFILDDEGVPLSVKVKERIDTNELIEEFMLLANNRVSEFMKDAPFFIYRVHDTPDPERMETLKSFLELLGYTNIPMEDGIIPPFALQRIIKEAEGKPVYETLQTVIVRSMQKAIYTTNNIGHFGLAFDSYSHFTSPIRRYPDVLAHRLVQNKLEGTAPSQDQVWYEKMCLHASEQESRAVTAERNSIKLKQVEYMKHKDPDEIFKGVVTGAGKFGVFVAEAESLSEGMIRLQDLGNDMWEFQEKSGTIKGKTTGKTFKIGDSVDIKIKSIDVEKRLIDYTLVLDGVSQLSKPSHTRPRHIPTSSAKRKPHPRLKK